MKIKFFEWSDYEEKIFTEIKDSLNLVNLELIFSPDRFSINSIDDAEIISIFIDSKIEDGDLKDMKLRGIKKILLRSTGFNKVNIEKAKELGIEVYRVASYNPESIAEHTFAILLCLVRNLMIDRRKHIALKDGRDVSQIGMTLRGKTLGIYGFGHIGQAVGNIAKYGFGMRVRYFDPFVTNLNYNFIPVNSLEELFMQSEIISINVGLNEETRGIIDKRYLSKTKDLVLVNTSRGEIVNTKDCLEALDRGNLSGIAFDVVGEDDSYRNLPVRDNIVFTQHTAFMTKEAVEEILRQTIENISNPSGKNKLA